MKRRNFLGRAAGAGLTGMALAAQWPKPAIAQGRRELRMVLSWPKDRPVLGASAGRLAGRIAQLSEGKLQVKVFGAGELVPAFEVFDAVASGAADVYCSAASYFQDRSKAFHFFAAVPFGLTAGESAAWLGHGGGQELWDELAKAFNLKPFPVGNTGNQMGGWLRKEIASVDDLKGLRFRMPGLGGDVLRRLGVRVVDPPESELLAALASGAIDGSVWMGPAADLAFGFPKAAKLYCYPGFHAPGVQLDLSINLKVWETLAKDQQELIRTVAAAENDLVAAEFAAANAAALDQLVAKHEVRLVKFADPILQALGAKAGEALAEIAAESPLAKKIFESYVGFRKTAIRWSRVGDQAFQAARLLPFRYGG